MLTLHEVLRRAMDSGLISPTPPTPCSAAIIVAGDNGRVAVTYATQEFLEDVPGMVLGECLSEVVELYLGRTDAGAEHPPADDMTRPERESAPAVVCSVCGRKSWAYSAGDTCNMPQPGGSRCAGTLEALRE